MAPSLIARKRDSFGEINLSSSQPTLLSRRPPRGRTPDLRSCFKEDFLKVNNFQFSNLSFRLPRFASFGGDDSFRGFRVTPPWRGWGRLFPFFFFYAAKVRQLFLASRLTAIFCKVLQSSAIFFAQPPRAQRDTRFRTKTRRAAQTNIIYYLCTTDDKPRAIKLA